MSSWGGSFGRLKPDFARDKRTSARTGRIHDDERIRGAKKKAAQRVRGSCIQRRPAVYFFEAPLLEVPLLEVPLLDRGLAGLSGGGSS